MSTPVIKVENLVKRYKELIAVDHHDQLHPFSVIL